jgi:hypothetical protein
MTKTVICKDVFGNEYETPIDDLDVRIGVYAVIIRDNKILLARQWEGYSIIGGGVEKGETLAVLHANDQEKAGQAEERFLRAYRFSETQPPKRPMIFGEI